MKKRHPEVRDYDEVETSSLIDSHKRLSLKDLGFRLPASPPTQVVSLRLPTKLLNEIRAKASNIDIPYQAFIKMALARAIGRSTLG